MIKDQIMNSLGNLDDDMIEHVDALRQKKRTGSAWRRWAAAAACLCLLAAAVTVIPHLGGKQKDPQPGKIVLSEQTTAKVSYGYDQEAAFSAHSDLQYLTEEEMFGRSNQYVFRGRVSGLTNVTADFNGEKEAYCIAAIVMDKVYRGDLSAGEQITMLIPCAIDAAGIMVEDTDVISQLQSGMEGIFMPRVYDENSRIEMNGAVLMKQDLAACGLTDGMRWVFLSADQGLLFDRAAYPGAGGAENLDDIETYVMKMLP